MAVQDLPHLDPEVMNRLAVGAGDLGSWRGGRFRGDLKRALGAVDIHDPVAREKLLGLGEDAVGDRPPVLARANQRCLLRRGQPLGSYQLAGGGQLPGELRSRGRGAGFDTRVNRAGVAAGSPERPG